MGDHQTNTLHYGHLGSATYLSDSQVWEFARKIEREPSLIFYGHVKRPLPVTDTPSTWSNTQTDDGPLSHKSEDVLLKARPELAPGLGLLGRYEVSSRAITSAVTKFDPQVSSLLALGNAIDIDRRGGGNSTVPLAVLVPNDSSASLQFVELEDEQVSWPPEEDAVANVPTLRVRDKALWSGSAGPVQQICFADTVDEKSTWLAVRFLQSTILFRPRCNKLPFSVRYGLDYMPGTQDTRLDANPILNLSISSTGGVSHADVTFNPWYQQQMAIVDRQGNWSVWDISKQPRSSQWHADRGASGNLELKESIGKEGVAQKDHYDGWASISWVGDVHRLLVCDRRNIALYRIDSDPVKSYRFDVGLQRESEWILDIKRSQSDLSNIFVLTTTQVLWLRVDSDEFSSTQQGERQEISVLLSWRHFRSQEDTSLRLASLLVQNDFSLVIYSRLNNMAQVFRFAFSPEDPSVPLSVADPFLIPLPTESSWDGKGAKKSSGEACFSSLVFQQVIDSSIPDPLNETKTVRLVKCLGQQTNLDVVESLYVARTDGEDPAYELFESTPPRKRAVRSAKWVDDDFIVDDLDDSLIPPLAGIRRDGDNGYAKEKPLRVSPYGENWIDIYALASVAVTSHEQSKGKPVGFENKTQTFDRWLENLSVNFGELVLGGSSPSALNSRSMLDILPSPPPFLDDIDRNTHDFDQFLRNLADPMESILPSGYQINCLPIPHSPFSNSSAPESNSSHAIPANITKLYDSLVRDWLFPLPGDFPNKIRMSKEKIIRNIVMQLILSRILFTRQLSPTPFPPDSQPTASDFPSSYLPSSIPTSSQNPTIAITSSAGTTEYNPSSLPFPSSQASTTNTTTLTTSPTQTPYQTLSLYTPLDSTSTSAPLLRRIATTLSHWKPGTDPATYNWTATVRTLQSEEELESESQSASRRRKRREARRLRRQQQQQLLATSQLESYPTSPSAGFSGFGSSQVPAIRAGGSQGQIQGQRRGQFLLGSSTGRGAPVVQSSQVTEGGDGVVMSQVERGVFGGRKVGKDKERKKKKKRAAGF
ncbi:hypothetical protein AJ79_01414 [Helicocarpus griseus UAMH5409]|uniref:RNA polymerase I-specific transcription initiation factor RRN6-like protein n=1 Tax=Helicocarpus griseus UAMH5409 TaxID=1447875 RepID=A0A2B7Y752_9EURO|nr:hypothetical protein AJ79_01414 [Helicocarpus griseus UAMH5409]